MELYIIIALVVIIVALVSHMIVKNRTDGEIVIDKTGDKDIYRLELSTPLDDLDKKKRISLKVTQAWID